MTATLRSCVSLPSNRNNRDHLLRLMGGLAAPIFVVEPWIWEGRCRTCNGLACRLDMLQATLRCPDCEGRDAPGPHPRLTTAAEETSAEELERLTATLEYDCPPTPFEEISFTASSAPPSEMVPGIIGRGEVVMLVADAGVGKSNLAAELCARLADGRPFLGIPTGPRPLAIGWLDWDTSSADVRATLARFGIKDNATIRAYSGHSAGHLDDAGCIDHLVRLVSGRGFGLLVIDSLSSACSGDENSTQDMRTATEALKRVARETGCSVLILHHTGKDGRYRGSTSLKAAAHRMLMLTARKGKAPSPTLTLQVAKQRHGIAMQKLVCRRIETEDGVQHVVDQGDESAMVVPAPSALPGETRSEDIMKFVSDQPGCTKSAIAKFVTGRKQDVLAEVDNLVTRERLRFENGYHAC